jgi:6-pyruvoyl-tetrahydropterin synthase
MGKEEYKYFDVPITMLRGLADNKKKTLRDITRYGAYTLTKTKKMTGRPERDFIVQFIYAYYNKPDSLTMELADKMEEAIDEGMFHVDEDHNGFAAGEGRKLNVDGEVHDLERIFEDDKEFQDMVIKFGKAKDAYQFYDMKKDFSYIFDWALEMEKTIPDNSPTVGIPQKKLKEFYSQEKTELEIMTFAAYLAIRSILGTKKYCRTTKEMILARTFGFRNMAELNQNPPTLYAKYSKRYWIDKLLAEVREWNIHIYSTNEGLRGMYVGHGISADEFENYVAERMKAKDQKHRKKVMNKRIREKIEKLKNDDLNDLA